MGNLTRGFTDEILSLSAEPIIGTPAGELFSTTLNRLSKYQDSPVRLYANATPSAVLNIAANKTQAGDGTYRSVAPASSTLPSYAGATINFDTGAVTGGTVQKDGSTFSLPSLTATGKYVRVCFVYDASSNVINTTFSAEAASQGALADPGTLFDLLSGQKIGYIDLVSVSAVNKFKTANSAGSSPLIENADIILFGSGAGSGEGGLQVVHVDHTFSGPLKTGKHYVITMADATSDITLAMPTMVDKAQLKVTVYTLYSGYIVYLNPGTAYISYREKYYTSSSLFPLGTEVTSAQFTGKSSSGYWVTEASESTLLPKYKNYIKNPSAELTTSGWGASGSITITQATAGTPRDYTTQRALAIASASANTYARYRFTLDNTDLNQTLSLGISFNNYTSSTSWRVEIHKNSAANYGGTYTEIPLSTDLDGNSVFPALMGELRALFDTDSTPYLELRVVHTAAIAGDEIRISDAFVSPLVLSERNLLIHPVDQSKTITMISGSHYIVNMHGASATKALTLPTGRKGSKIKVSVKYLPTTTTRYEVQLTAAGSDKLLRGAEEDTVITVGEISDWIELSWDENGYWVIDEPMNYTSRTLAGNWTVDGSLGFAHAASSGTGFTSNALKASYYEEATLVSTVANMDGSPSITLKLVRIGKIVTITSTVVPSCSPKTTTSGPQLNNSLPANFRPSVIKYLPWLVRDYSVYEVGHMVINPSGVIAFAKGNVSAAWTAGGTCEIQTSSASYSIA